MSFVRHRRRVYVEAPPDNEFELARESCHARGAVAVFPLLHQASEVRELVRDEQIRWPSTPPMAYWNPSTSGHPIRAQTAAGAENNRLLTGDTYGVNGAGQTFSVDWWMNTIGSYFGADGAQAIVGNRQSTGWYLGSYIAVGGAPGNITSLRCTFSGVADYNANDFNVPARTWVHCGVTYGSGFLRFYVGGVETQSWASPGPTAGGNLVMWGTNDTVALNWGHEAHSVIVRDIELSPGEMALRADRRETWGLYRPRMRRRYFLPLAPPAGSNEKLGDIDIEKRYVGSNEVTAVYLGSNQIWPSS